MATKKIAVQVHDDILERQTRAKPTSALAELIWNSPDADADHVLKAPKVKIGPAEITQIQKYQLAVTSDERFSTVKGLKWHFWVISNDLTEFAENSIKGGPDPRNRLIYRSDSGVILGIKTWAEIIEENRARLQFFQEHLNHNADQNASLRHLREKHSEFLAGITIDESEHPQEETKKRRASKGKRTTQVKKKVKKSEGA